MELSHILFILGDRCVRQVQVSIIVIADDNSKNLNYCLNSIHRHSSVSYEVIYGINETKGGKSGAAEAYNEALLKVNGRIVVFIHSDIVVVPNWLESIIDLLESDDMIAGVGPVTHYISPVVYEPVSNHIRAGSKNEVRLFLDRFCFAVKREVIKRIGLFDSIFNTDAYAMYDYQLRIAHHGYKLKLINNLFVHHNGNLNHLMIGKFGIKDQLVWMKKWVYPIGDHLSYIAQQILTTTDNGNDLKILDINAGYGANLYYLKNALPTAQIYGVEMNPIALDSAAHFAEVRTDIEFFKQEKFDVIIINSSLEKHFDIESVITDAKSLLKQDGYVIFPITNTNSFKRVIAMLRGQELLQSQSYGDLSFIIDCFEKAGYKEMDIDYIEEVIGEEYITLLAQIKMYTSEEVYNNLKFSKFYLKAYLTTKEERLASYLKQCFNSKAGFKSSVLLGIDFETAIELMSAYPVHQQVKWLNQLCSELLRNSEVESASPYLKYLVTLDPNGIYTIEKLILYYYLKNDWDKVNEWISRIDAQENEPDDLKIIESIKLEKEKKEMAEYLLRFLLWRVEYDVESDKASEMIGEALKRGTIEMIQILSTLNDIVLNKILVINRIVVAFNQKGFYDFILPFLHAAQEINKDLSDK